MRGQSSLLGAVDTVLEISANESTRTAIVTKQRDGASGQGFAFSLAPVGIGLREPDAQGIRETVTACVVRYEGAAQRQKPRPKEGHQTNAMAALRLNARETGRNRWTMKEAGEVFAAYHQHIMGPNEKPLHRTYPAKVIQCLASSGHLLIEGGFVTLEETP